MSAHLSEWTLRRLHVGELSGSEALPARAHVSGCRECREVMRDFAEAQARFEAEVPFERFAAGVERKASTRPVVSARPRLKGLLVAVAATVLLAVGVQPLLSAPPSPTSRLKGSGASAELRIGSEGTGQRAVTPGILEALAPGERVRLGYTPGPHRYVLAVSVDEAGEVSPLYPESGTSLPVEAGAGTHWLPDSLVFTGAGHERVVVVLSEAPLEVETARAAAVRAFEAGGRDVAAMPPLGVGGEETHWLLRKR
jgi:hypothetical protein